MHIGCVCLFLCMESVRLRLERSSRREGSSDQIPPSSVSRKVLRCTHPVLGEQDCYERQLGCEWPRVTKCVQGKSLQPGKAFVWWSWLEAGCPSAREVAIWSGWWLRWWEHRAGIRVESWCVVGLVVSEHEQQWTSHRHRHRPERKAAEQSKVAL